jgi:hypothetical protein
MQCSPAEVGQLPPPSRLKSKLIRQQLVFLFEAENGEVQSFGKLPPQTPGDSNFHSHSSRKLSSQKEIISRELLCCVRANLDD